MLIQNAASAVSTPSQQSSEDTFTVHTTCLFEPKSKRFLPNISIVVSTKTGTIVDFIDRATSAARSLVRSPRDIDLGGKCVLPGFVDAHTHILLHSYGETPAAVQERDESWTERIIRATNHVRAALLAGYTTYLDYGTEGVGACDVGVRDAINRGIIPGPRLFVATEPLAGSGGYEFRTENEHTKVYRIADQGDGVVGVRAAVRRRIAAGADVIKFYSDYRKRQLRFPSPLDPAKDIQFPPDTIPRNPNIPLFNQEEMDEIVREATLNGAPVVAHGQEDPAAAMAVKAGITTLTHAPFISKETVRLMAEKGTWFAPTLAIFETSFTKADMARAFATTKYAYECGVNLATGGDTGGFNHGENIREAELMLEAGVPLDVILQALTLGGFHACGGERTGYKFGWWGKGCRADIVALDVDPRTDGGLQGSLRSVDFVMKDGRVWKKDGNAVGMV